jgi:hypothetical protein
MKALFAIWMRLALIACSINCLAQCDTAVVVESLPYQDSFCTPNYIETLIQNPYQQNTPVFGCWNAIINSHWYIIESGPFGGPLTMTVDSDLFNPQWPNEQNVHTLYAVFTECPADGGTIISYPCNCFNPQGECWDQFGGGGDFIQSSCIWTDITTGSFHWECQGSEPWWNFGGAHYQITFDMDANTTYYIAVWPSNNIFQLPVYGCIDVLFSGPLLLELPEPCWIQQDRTGGVITLYGGGLLERSRDTKNWQNVKSPDSPGPGVWYYRACDKIWGFKVPETIQYMEFDTLGRRIK